MPSKTTLYLIRHAQSVISTTVKEPDWPLSDIGRTQADRLVQALGALGIERLYSSPYQRCRDTIAPFAQAAGLTVEVRDALRERLIAKTFRTDFQAIWARSWADRDFHLPDCESSRACQRRVLEALEAIARAHRGETIGVASHGNAIALVLNAIEPAFGQEAAEQIRNPDIHCIWCDGDGFYWDQRDVPAAGLAAWATHFTETPMRWDAPSDETSGSGDAR